VPTFIHDGHTLYQSLAIMEYLDDIKPSPRLLPDDIKERAYARSLALMTIADVHPLTVPRVRKHLATTFGADAHAIEAWGAHWSTEGLVAYERFLARRKPAPFALGKDVGIADICIAGNVVGSQYLKIGLDAYPLVKDLSDRLFKLPEFSSSHPFEQPDYKASGAKH
jgi:maleylacetoacetate isomerase